ncbi:MAG TPA: MFS transporter, partial [Streptosporangiaceae bacterium]|nr:MFS transporter [Streptosporangiaceae bacterium]
GLGLLMYGVSEGPNAGWGHWPIVASCAAGVVALTALVVVELRRREPLLRLRLLRDRLFSVSNTVMVLASIAFIGTVYLVSLFYQDGLGLSALQAGLSTFPEAVGVMLGAQIVTKRLYPVLGPRRIIVGGLLLTAAGITALLAIGPATNLWWARLVLFVVGLGMSGVFIPTQTAAFAAISQEDMGGASMLFNTLRQLGGAVGVAVLTTVLVAIRPFSPAGGRLVPDLTSYRAAFLVAAAVALIAAGIAARIRDEDAASTITRWHGRRADEPSDTGQRGGERPAAGHARPRSHRSAIGRPLRRWRRRRRLPARARYRAPSSIRKRNPWQETWGAQAPGRAKASISPGEGVGSPAGPGSVMCPAARRVSMAGQPKSHMTAAHDADGAAGLPAPAGGDRPVRRILVFTIVALALLMMSVDSTIVATALHSLQHELATSINWAGWVITGYSFGFVLMLPVSGKLSEQYGRRRVFLASVITFSAASLCCGLAGNIYLLIVLRVVQAAGGAGFTPSATGIVVDYFGDARDRAVSLFGSIFPVGAMIGPIFGGLFVSYWSWRGIFFVNVPIGAAVLVLSLRYIPRDPPRTRARPEMDAAGMALLGTGLLAGMLAASYLGEDNARPWSPLLVVPLVIAVVALWMFFRHISRSPQPFLAPRLIHGPGFGPVNLVNVIFSGVTFGMVALIPLYATNRYHIGALGSGTLLIAQGAAAILLSIAAALALRRTGHRPLLYAGTIVIAVGMTLLALSPIAGIPPYAWLAGSAFLIGVGSGTINPPSRNAGLQLAPEHSSTLAALRSMSLQVGSITTISIATAILASSNESGTVQAWFYVAVALLLVATLPLITRVPEYHGSW